MATPGADLSMPDLHHLPRILRELSAPHTSVDLKVVAAASVGGGLVAVSPGLDRVASSVLEPEPEPLVVKA